jgi:hypothetical protein
MHPKLALRQWGVLKHRQKMACDSVYALLLAIHEVSLQTLRERARELDRVRDAAKALAAIDTLSPKALKASAKVTLKLSKALQFVARMEIDKEEGAAHPPAAGRRRSLLEKV